MKLRIALFAAGIVVSPFIACAADAPAASAQSTAPDQPWMRDNALLDATITDVRNGGIKAVASHAAELEQALAGAKHSFELAVAGDDKTTYALSDDPNAAVQDIMATAADKAKKPVTAAFNPYPGISYFLGSYYDGAGKPEDGLRVLAAGLALPGTEASLHRVDLLVERGAALAALKRWEDALAAYDEALKIEDIAPGLRAYIHRGRGLVLVEMGRMSEGKAAYEDAMKLTVNDENAKRELEIIEQLHDGGPKLPSRFAPKPDQTPSPAQANPPPKSP